MATYQREAKGLCESRSMEHALACNSRCRTWTCLPCSVVCVMRLALLCLAVGVLTQVWLLDLASLKSVREFGAKWEKEQRPLHILINNAGIYNIAGTRRYIGCGRIDIWSRRARTRGGEGGIGRYLIHPLHLAPGTPQHAAWFVSYAWCAPAVLLPYCVSGARQETQDGFESHIGANHLGHFLLTLMMVGRAGRVGGWTA